MFGRGFESHQLHNLLKRGQKERLDVHQVALFYSPEAIGLSVTYFIFVLTQLLRHEKNTHNRS